MNQVIDEQKAKRAFYALSKAIKENSEEIDWLGRCNEIISSEIQEIRQSLKNLFQINLN
jgi:hypothetical protein